MSEVNRLPKWMWWKKGNCVVEIIKRGHYPNTVMVKLPLETITEVEQDDLLKYEEVQGVPQPSTSE